MNDQLIKIGCHVSIAGGVMNAPKNASDLECETFQIFTRSPQGGPAPKLTFEIIDSFQSEMKKYGFTQFVIHAPYFINFGSTKKNIYHGSIEVVRTDLERGSLLGADNVMFHMGSFASWEDQDEAQKSGMKQVKEGLKIVLDGYEGKTKLLLENAAGAGSVAGDTFEEIADVIGELKDFSGFGGVCFDTQHAFGSGYNLSDKKAVNKTFKEFDEIIGLKYLSLIQANDSMVPLGSKKDRHDHIDEGLIGKQGFGAILDYLKSKKIRVNLILETKHDKVINDIKILKKLRE